MQRSALLFDFDGLILDTEVPEYTAWCEVYQAHGCELQLDVWCGVVGRPVGVFDPYAHLEGLSGRPVDRDAVRARRRARSGELIAAERPRPGVEAYLREARNHGMKLAVVSSSERPWVEGHLARLGLLSFFHDLVCAGDTERHKPDPAPYLEALRRLGLDAAEAVAIEDSANGVAAARAAGLFVLAVPNAITRHSDLSAASLRCDSLADLPLVALLERLGQTRDPASSVG